MGSNYPRGDPPPGRQRQVPPRGDPPPGRQRVPPRLLINPFHDIRQRLSTGQAFKPIGQVSVSRMLPGPPLFGRLASQLFEVDPSLAFSTAGDSAEEGGESTLPPPQVPRVPRDFCETTLISFLGRRYKIILQSKNGPYSLIAICNYLILTRKLTLPPSMTIVYLDYLVDRVFSQVFSKMKDESYKTAQAAVEQTATGLDIDIYCTSVDGFEDTPQYGLFRILDIPLYHAWVLDMNNQEDTILLNAVDGRSYNQLNIDRAKYNSKKDADFMIDAAETRRYELIHTFLKDNPGQVTEFGLHTLKAATPDRKLFIFFQNEHFNVVYKYHGRFFVLESDVGFRNYQNIWRSVDSPGESGVLVHDITISRDQHSVLKSGNYFEGAKQSFKKKPHSARQTQHHSVSSSLESSQGPPPVRHSHMAGEHGSSSSVKPRPSPTNAQLETRPPSPGTVRADFASYFTSGKDQKLEHMFLDFLRSFERNNIPYYGAIVDAMKTLSSPEMHIHFDHIWSYAPELAHDLCQCYPRWIPLRTFLKLRGYHLTKPRHIRCDGFFLPVIDTTQIGRIILTNLLTRITRSHKGGRSWNGNWTLDHVMVSDSLDVKINLPCNYQAARKTEAHDFLRVATDVLPEYEKTGDSNVKSRMVVYPLSPQFILLYMNTTELTWKKVNPMNKEMRMQKKKVMNLEAMLGMMVEMKNALYNLNVESINPLRTQWKEAWFTYAMFVIMDNMGKQQFLRLSDLELVNSNSLDEILPAMVKCLIFHKDGYHHIYDKDIYDRVLGWIDEILENYELLEFPKSYGIDFPAITPTGHDDAFPDPHSGIGGGSSQHVGVLHRVVIIIQLVHQMCQGLSLLALRGVQSRRPPFKGHLPNRI
uniref:MINDY deubiquitinase domain-containing protein n=1 Tax=Oryza glumipatula TaxID=40148 RepID=A0A0E0AEG7_9ORYZ